MLIEQKRKFVDSETSGKTTIFIIIFLSQSTFLKFSWSASSREMRKMLCAFFLFSSLPLHPGNIFCVALKGNLISWNFIFQSCLREMPIYRYSNFLRCQLRHRLEWGKIRHDFRSIFSKFSPFPSRLRDHSQIFVTQWELMSKNISFDSPTHRLWLSSLHFSRDVFFFFLFFSGCYCRLFYVCSQPADRDTWIYDDDVMLALAFPTSWPLGRKKWSGKFPFIRKSHFTACI